MSVTSGDLDGGVIEASANEAFGIEDGVLGVNIGLILRSGANETTLDKKMMR